MSGLRIRRALVATAFLLAAGAGWFFLAPTQLGGSTSYVAVHGTSMLPRFHTDDLVVTRAAGSYRVGDVVVYHNRQLNRAVLHRIVAVRNGRFVIKGDANGFVDEPPARPGDVAGKLWFRIPGGAKVLLWAREPLHAAVIVGLLALLLLGGGAGGKAVRRRRASAPRSPLLGAGVPEGAAATGLAVAAALGLASLVLGVVALAHPSRRTVTIPKLYAQSGTFSYHAHAPVGAAYPDGRVHTGQAVFAKLVNTVSMSFAYRFAAAEPHAVSGTGGLTAVISDGQGWQRTLVLEPPTRFRGDRVRVHGGIRLSRVEAEIRHFVVETGTDSGAYTVTVKPHVAVAGLVGGSRVATALSGSFGFHVDPLRLTLLGPATPGSGNPLAVSRSTAGTRTLPGELAFPGGLAVGLGVARLAALLGLLVALVAALGFGLLLRTAQGLDEADRIVARYRDWLVEIAEPRRRSAERMIRVDGFEHLFRLAETCERMVLHERSGDDHLFVVEHEGVAYWYSPPAPAGASEPDRTAGPRAVPDGEGELAHLPRHGWATGGSAR